MLILCYVCVTATHAKMSLQSLISHVSYNRKVHISLQGVIKFCMYDKAVTARFSIRTK